MDALPDQVSVFSKPFDLLLEAESATDAARGFAALEGSEVTLGSGRVFFRDVRAVEGEIIDPTSYEAEGLPLYPGRATIVVMADSLDEAEALFFALDGSVTAGDDEREVSLEMTDVPAEEGTMPAPPESEPSLPRIGISRWARRFIVRQGGSVWVWTEPFGGGWGRLCASTIPPSGIDFELHPGLDSGDEVSVFLEEGLMATALMLRLQPFPRAKIVVSGPLSPVAAGPY